MARCVAEACTSTTWTRSHTVIGELAANALEHTASRSLAVTLALAGRSVVVTVTDEGAGDIPVTALPEGDDEHGRGLFMVAALAHRWGGRRSRQGLTGWRRLLCRRP
ncbi:ATP-binding protein [Streptomyces sp. PSAA01]|uniref:ATP-binding protein n=1 Tax=Streptomyces sp. PSAA01 TaxID=2912762 RepID=UPI001F30D4A4|nr:ATP-binding protein [Streptomyces sp. PSAA01]MCG0287615.1 ATP-binding protein [Streptomyces sp. PSAA01]